MHCDYRGDGLVARGELDSEQSSPVEMIRPVQPSASIFYSRDEERRVEMERLMKRIKSAFLSEILSKPGLVPGLARGLGIELVYPFPGANDLRRPETLVAPVGKWSQRDQRRLNAPLTPPPPPPTTATTGSCSSSTSSLGLSLSLDTEPELFPREGRSEKEALGNSLSLLSRPSLNFPSDPPSVTSLSHERDEEDEDLGDAEGRFVRTGC